MFHWARNVLRPKSQSTEYWQTRKYENSSVCALFWNLIKALGPQEVVADFVALMKQMDGKRMDGDSGTLNVCGQYSIDVEGEQITFHEAELAPPAALFAHNYAR